MNEQEINLSIIGEVKQHPHDHEDIDEILHEMGSPKKSCQESEIEIDFQELFQNLPRKVHKRRENQLTAKLRMIRQYIFAQRQRTMQLGDYLLRKFKNLVRCVHAHQATQEEDYRLLFEIFLQTHRRLPRLHEQFLHQLSLATSKLPASEASPVPLYLQIIYHLVRIKMAGQQARNAEVEKLRSYCELVEWRRVQVFPLKDILRTHFGCEGEVKDFQFLDGLTNEYREVKQEITSGQVDLPLMHKLENETEETKDTRETREGSLKIESHKPKMEIPKLIEELEQRTSLDKQLQDSIHSIPLIQIKKSPQGKNIVRKLLHLSFKHLKLMGSSIEKALYILQIDEFINQVKHLLNRHSTGQNLADAKRIIKKQLKDYCGKDSLYYWSKIQP